MTDKAADPVADNLKNMSGAELLTAYDKSLILSDMTRAQFRAELLRRLGASGVQTNKPLRDQVEIAKQNGSRWIHMAVVDIEPLLGASEVDVEQVIINWMAADKTYWREAAKDLAAEIRKHIAQPAAPVPTCIKHPFGRLPEGRGLWEVPHGGCDYPSGGCNCYCGINCQPAPPEAEQEESNG